MKKKRKKMNENDENIKLCKKNIEFFRKEIASENAAIKKFYTKEIAYENVALKKLVEETVRYNRNLANRKNYIYKLNAIIKLEKARLRVFESNEI